MSVTYASTSFGVSTLESTESQPRTRSQSPRPESSRHHRQNSRSSELSGSSTAHGELPSPPPPVAATAQATTRGDMMLRAQYDQIGAFFGGGSVGPNRPMPRNDPSHMFMTANARSEEGHSPPSYTLGSDIETLPSYTRNEDYDAIVSRKLFKYGFSKFFFLSFFPSFDLTPYLTIIVRSSCSILPALDRRHCRAIRKTIQRSFS